MPNSFQLTSSVGGSNLPFTIGLPFKKGDIADTPVLDLANYQAIVKTRWNDGSVKMAIASGKATLTADIPSTVTISNGAAVGGAALTASDIAAANPAASVTLGAYGTVTLASLLATPFRTWVSGPQMVECHYRSAVGTDPALAVWFHVRLYQSGHIWIRAIVENGYVNIVNAQKDYIPEVSINGVTIFTNSGLSLAHYANTRWMQEGWIGGDPAITPKHDPTYLISTKLVPNYWKRNPSATVLNSLTQSYTPMTKADLTADMSNTGFQAQIGLLPKWDALYVTSGDARAYNSCLANSSSYNSYAIVWRDPNTNLIPKPTDWPTYVANVSHWAGSLQWEMAHAPSEGYLAYLITGDYWHYETMQMNSAINYLTRNNNTGDGVNRNLLSQTRGVAWNLRTLTQAVAIATSDDTVAADYKTLLTNNIATWQTIINDLSGGGIGYLYDYEVATTAYATGVSAPWQHHFWIQVMGMGSDIEPLASMTTFNAVRDHLYKGVVGILGDATGYYFTNAYAYNIKIANIETWLYTDYFSDWNTVFNASITAGNITGDTTGNTLLGGGGGAPSAAATGYWGNLLPAIAYAVDHLASGASAAWARLTGASNWAVIETSGFDDLPIWGIYPRTPIIMAFATDDFYTTALNGTVRAGRLTSTTWPAWRRAIPANTVVEIGSNSLADLNPRNNPAINPNYPNSPEWQGSTGQDSITYAWCGAVWDETTETLILPLGGGHTNYAGNESYKLQLNVDSPEWVMLRPPSGAIGNILTTNDGQEATGNYADGRPRAIHSYNKHVFVPGVGPVMSLQGSTAWSATGGTLRTMLLNTTTGEWEFRTNHPYPGASTSGSAACYDSIRHCIWYKPKSDGRPAKLDIATWAWTAYTWYQYDPSWDYKRLIHLPEYDLIFQADGAKTAGFCLWSPTTGTIYQPGVTNLPPTGVSLSGIAGVEWDGTRLLIWHNNSSTNVIGTLTPTGDPAIDPWVWGAISFSGFVPSVAVANGTYGRFAYSRKLNGCILQNATAQKTYFFSLG